MNIEEYRKVILEQILAAKADDGTPRVDEATATEMLGSLSDEELQEGMLFNTPEDVAEMVLEVL